MVDTSHGLEIPFGGIGTGFSAFGKYGFVAILSNVRPLNTEVGGDSAVAKAPHVKPAVAFVLNDGTTMPCCRKQRCAGWPTLFPWTKFWLMPFFRKVALFLKRPASDWGLTMTRFSPLVSHDLANSTIPVQMFDITTVFAAGPTA